MTQRDDMGRVFGRGVQDWELMYTHGGFVLMYGINAGEGVEKTEPSYTVGGNVN